MFVDPSGLVAPGNHKLDPAQLESIRQQLKDPGLDKKTRNALNQKLKKHDKATGDRLSRKSKDKKSKRLRSINPYMISIAMACMAGYGDAEICDLLGYGPDALECPGPNISPYRSECRCIAERLERAARSLWVTLCHRPSLIESVKNSPSHFARLSLSLRMTRAWRTIEQIV